METNYSETTLRDYVRVLFRHKAVIIITFITVMATVAIFLQLKTPVYEARVKLLISAEKQVEAPYYRELIGYRGQVVLTQNEIVKSSPVIERAVEAMALYTRPLDYEKQFCSPLKKALIDFRAKKFNETIERLTDEQKMAFLFRKTVEDLKKTVRVEPINNTNLFTITATEFSPIGAAIIANVVSRSYAIFDLEQQLAELKLKYGEKHLSVKQLRDSIDQMSKGLNGAPLSNIEAIGPASVKILEQAQISLEPVGLNELFAIPIAIIMSLFLGIMFAFILEYTNQTFKSPQDIKTFLNLPFLGSIPKKKKLKREALRYLSDLIYLLMKEKSLQSLLLTSALPREGNTTITVNLGKHLSSNAGNKVLIIDANLRRPAIHKAFKIADTPGLANVLEGKVSFEEAIKNVDSNLNILPAGKTKFNPIALLDSSKIQELLNTAKQQYEIILIDTAHLKNFKDAHVLLASSDGIALVVNEGTTRRQVVKNAIMPLEKQNGKFLGAILNNRRLVIPKLIYDRV